MNSRPCRIVIDDQPGSGQWNMAVDETLLESALNQELCTVRIYQWREATLSLGYFQNASEREGIPAVSTLPCVRRLSGGGAIVHHHELTYSLAVPLGHPLVTEPRQLYGAIHARIIQWLAEAGIAAELRGNSTTTGTNPSEPFLCFSRGDSQDIICDGKKILGSAQRRRKGAVLQHGSLVLQTSSYAPHVLGLKELVPSQFGELSAETLGTSLASVLSDNSSRSPLIEQELRRAEQLEREKYHTLDWKHTTTENKNVERSNYFG